VKRAILAVSVLAMQLAFVGMARAVIIGVDIEAGNGSPTNWNGYSIGNVGSALSNLTREDGSSSGVSFTLFGVTATQNFSVSSAALVPSHPLDLTSVCCDILHAGPNPTLARWSGLTPLATYRYWVFTSSAASDSITVTGDNVDAFASPAVSQDSQRINGVVGDSTLTFASYARQVTASAAGTIDIAILSGGTPTPSGYAIEPVAAVAGPAAPIPTLSEWALISFAALLGLSGVAAARRRRQS
jgi:hypothetical protein